MKRKNKAQKRNPFIKGGGKKAQPIYIDMRVYDLIKDRAFKNDRSVNGEINSLLKKALEKEAV